ncbi:MAG: putative toxin-antitoxin system toxin component, PIN family [Anaerolineae bacterium]
MPERVVFDTNIWISGLLWRGKPYQCLTLARANLVQLVYCREMMAELARKLRHPFGFTDNRVQAVLHQYRRISQRVDISGALHGVVPDPDDDMFVECALVGNAEVIVSGDQHLLDLGVYQNVVILTADAFVSRVIKRG